MAVNRRKFSKGIRLKANDDALTLEGELSVGETDKKLKAHVDGASRDVLTADQVQDVENKTIDATAATGNNTLSADSDDIVYDPTTSGMTATNVKSALDELKAGLEGQNEASEITFDPSSSTLADTNVQDAIDSLDVKVEANAGSVSDHIANATGAHTASAITNVPSGNLAAINVQGALDELQGDIDGLASSKMDAANPSATGVMDYEIQDFAGVTTTLNPNSSVVHISGAVTELESLLSASFTTNERVTLINASGGDINIVNQKVPNDGNRIKTGTGKDITLAEDASIILQYDEHDNFWHVVGGTGAGGGATQFEIEQVAHGFAVGEGIYHNGTTWVKAQANDADTLAYYVVIEVVDVDNFVAADFGRIEAVAHGYTVGDFYFLSDSVAGQATNVEPSSFSNPLFYVEDANTLQVKCLRPSAVGVDLDMDGLSDVSSSSAVADDFLQYNGSIWQPARVEQQIISLTAAEGVSAGDALYVNSIGQAALVDADDDDKIEFIGFAKSAALASNPVEIVVSGKLGGFSSLTPGEMVYASASTPGAIVQPEPTQANVYLIKVGKAISATEILVNPDLAASAEFNREVVADLSITNNQAVPTSIAGLSFSGATHRAVVLRYSIYRVTDTNEVSQTGQLRLTYKTNAASWSISDDFGGDDAGVTFSIDATGQVLYASTDLTGTGYSSNLKVNTVELFDV
jgi:hypothetical protein